MKQKKRIGGFKKRLSENTSEKKQRMKRKEQRLWKLWNSNKRANSGIIVVENAKREESLFTEVPTEKLPNLQEDTNTQEQESQRPPNLTQPSLPQYIL